MSTRRTVLLTTFVMTTKAQKREKMTAKTHQRWDTFSKFRLYRVKDAVKSFINMLRGDVKKIGNSLYGNDWPGSHPQLTDQKEAVFQQETSCHIFHVQVQRSGAQFLQTSP